jgi:hypothetical protein
VKSWFQQPRPGALLSGSVGEPTYHHFDAESDMPEYVGMVPAPESFIGASTGGTTLAITSLAAMEGKFNRTLRDLEARGAIPAGWYSWRYSDQGSPRTASETAGVTREARANLLNALQKYAPEMVATLRVLESKGRVLMRHPTSRPDVGGPY